MQYVLERNKRLQTILLQKGFTIRHIALLALFFMTLLSAQEETNSSVKSKKITIYTAMLSNYIWRGATLDSNKAVVQAAYSVEYSGLYASMFMSSSAALSDIVPSAGYRYASGKYRAELGMYSVILAPTSGYRVNIAGEAYVKFSVDLGVRVGINGYQELLANKKYYTQEVTLFQDLDLFTYLIEAGHNLQTSVSYAQLTLNIPSAFTGGNWVLIYGSNRIVPFSHAWGVGHNFVF